MRFQIDDLSCKNINIFIKKGENYNEKRRNIKKKSF